MQTILWIGVAVVVVFLGYMAYNRIVKGRKLTHEEAAREIKDKVNRLRK